MADRFEVKALPDAALRARLRAEALRPDTDLPAADRSGRAVILTLNGRQLVVDDVVTLIDGSEVAVIAAGRGRSAFQYALTEDGQPCRGTATAAQIATVQTAATGGR